MKPKTLEWVEVEHKPGVLSAVNTGRLLSIRIVPVDQVDTIFGAEDKFIVELIGHGSRFDWCLSPTEEEAKKSAQKWFNEFALGLMEVGR